MLDLLDAMLDGTDLGGARVCLVGTEFTVGQPAYADRIERAGAAEVIRLGATRTERTVAHLQHRTREGRDVVRAEIADGLRDADAAVLACTCFPLIADLFEETSPGIRLLDPGRAISGLYDWPVRDGTNHLTLAMAGDAPSPDAVQVQELFPGWDQVEVVSLAD
jgi:glutamate racemase